MAAIALVGNMLAPGGTPASGCKLSSVIRNTSTPSPLYSDVGLTTPTTNPFVGDADGRLDFYFDGAIQYTWTVRTSDDGTIVWQADVVGGVVTPTYVDGVLIHATWALPLATALGSGWKDAFALPVPDGLSGQFVKPVATYAALTALAASTGLQDDGIYLTAGRAGDEDGGQGYWRYDAASVVAANGGTVLAISGGGAGRFFRLYNGPVYARWFGSALNTAIADAITAGFDHILIDADFTLTTKITLGGETVLEGIGQRRPIITKGANVDMLDLSATDSALRFLNIQGAGATYTGRGVVIGGGTDQSIEDCYILDHNGFALEFTAADAGQRFRASRSLFRRTTTTNPAVGLPTGASEAAGNRYFDQCGGLGGTLMAFRQGINTMLTGCNFTGLDFSGSSGISLRAIISACRGAILGGTLTVNGQDVSIEGGVWAGDIVLDTGTQRCRIIPGGLATGSTITDNSTATGNNVNEVHDGYYTPSMQWKGDTTDPVIGNGSITTRVYRSGRKLKVDVALAIGSTTTFGSGAWYFQLPAPFNSWVAKAGVVGTARIFDSGTTYYAGIPVMSAGSGRIYLWLDNSSSNVNPAAPMTWANGDTLTFSIEYEIA